MWARWRSCCSSLGFAWARRRLDDEARRELEAHLGLLVERYRRAGLTPEQADVAARRRLGNVTLVREEIHRINGIQWRGIGWACATRIDRSDKAVRDGQAQRARVLRVTASYFRTLRSGPLRGPGFGVADESGAAGWC